MIVGGFNPKLKKVHVVGAGISGLLMSHRLLKLGYQVSLFEKNETIGGMIQSDQNQYGVFERSIHSMRADQKLKDYISEIGCEFWVQKKGLKKYIYSDIGLRKPPILKFVFSSLWKKTKFFDQDVNFEEWGEAYFGKDFVLQVLDPIFFGIYGVESKMLSVGLIAPELLFPKGKNLFASIVKLNRKKRTVLTIQGGMSGLPEKVFQACKQFEGFHFFSNKTWLKKETDVNTVFCAPFYQLPKEAFSKSEHYEKLSSLHYTDLVCVHIASEKKDSRSWVGVLSEKNSELSSLGVLFDHQNFPEVYSSSAYSFILGETKIPNIVEKSDDEILSLVSKDRNLLSISSESITYQKIHRWKKALPVYDQNLYEFIHKLKKEDSLFFSASTGSLSVRQMMERCLEWSPEW